MATIKIDNLIPTGAELFFDSESFMEELSNDELMAVLGGVSKPEIKPLYNECTDIVSYVVPGPC
jgi:bacteriocin-like protein